jgi:hypothetical protein
MPMRKSEAFCAINYQIKRNLKVMPRFHFFFTGTLKIHDSLKRNHIDFEPLSWYPRTWQAKRLTYSKKNIYFTNVDSDIVMDMIPLTEVLSVKDAEMNAHEMSSSNVGNIELSSSGTSEMTIFKIETIVDGYNSGRSYHVKVSNH